MPAVAMIGTLKESFDGECRVALVPKVVPMLRAAGHEYDVRPAVKQEVESLGARFVDLPLDTAEAQDHGGYARPMDEGFYRSQRETMARVVADSDVVITTAAVPGKKAPTLVTQEMVAAMRPGSVLVDVAADRGGNCAATQPGETIVVGNATVIGPINLPSSIAHDASAMYAKNVAAFLQHLTRDGALQLDLEGEIVRDALLVHHGEVVNPTARTDPDCPIAGMPILDVDRARSVVAIKAQPQSGLRGDRQSPLCGGKRPHALRRREAGAGRLV